MTGVAGLLTERCVHGAAGGGCRGHWTPVPIRGTTEGDYLVVPWSSRWSRGPGGSVRVPSSSRFAQRTSARRSRPRQALRHSRGQDRSTGGAVSPAGPRRLSGSSHVRTSASLRTTAPARRHAPSTDGQISALIRARPQTCTVHGHRRCHGGARAERSGLGHALSRSALLNTRTRS